MTLVLSTESVPDQDKVRYWHDVVNRTLMPLTVTPWNSTPFDGRVRVESLGYLRVLTVDADAERLRRTSRHIERSRQEYVAVGLQASGSAWVTQDGRSDRIGSGDLVIYDSTRPYSFDYPERFRLHVFQLPRRVLSVPDGELRRVTGTAIRPDQGVAAMLSPFLSALAAAPAHSASVGDRLAGNVTDLLATLVTERAGLASGETDTARGHLVRRIRQYINHHLADSGLSPEAIAEAHCVSVRYLHRLFEGEGITVSRLIQQRRLEECSRELARRSRVMPTVSAVAQRWGFVNAAHFSRTFKAAYGVSPREWRRERHATAA
ncbi:helix-turn-helix domain-containing protein [Streptomyces sp.]|uniref:AraC-like ligand-binding domain-containing protein n=1 Tax=Streptomyces sp. TaxID=1931 RepID=UPI002F3F1A93